jgi:hypothetical protein
MRKQIVVYEVRTEISTTLHITAVLIQAYISLARSSPQQVTEYFEIKSSA